MKKTITESQLKHIVMESVKRILREENEARFSNEEISKLFGILNGLDLGQMYEPYNLGWCKVQQIQANEVPGKMSMFGNANNLYQIDNYGGNLYIQIGRENNSPWHEENGKTFMCWK